MKKLFQKIDSSYDSHQHFIGKAFSVGRHNVIVEETIAEGLLHIDNYFRHVCLFPVFVQLY